MYSFLFAVITCPLFFQQKMIPDFIFINQIFPQRLNIPICIQNGISLPLSKVDHVLLWRQCHWPTKQCNGHYVGRSNPFQMSFLETKYCARDRKWHQLDERAYTKLRCFFDQEQHYIPSPTLFRKIPHKL